MFVGNEGGLMIGFVCPTNEEFKRKVKALYERGIAHGVMVLSLRVPTTFRDWQDKGLNI